MKKKFPLRALGRHVEHDPKSRAFAFEVTRPVPLRTIAWPRFAPIYDQAQEGACTGMAFAGCRSTGPLSKGPQDALTVDDAFALYHRATFLDNIPGHWPTDTGSSGIAVCKAGKERGLCSAYKHAFSVGAALAAMMFQPFIVGMPWFESFDEVGTGDEELPPIGGELRGGHEVSARKYDHEKKRIYIDNSWSEDWAIQGGIWIPLKTFEELMARKGDVTIPHVP